MINMTRKTEMIEDIVPVRGTQEDRWAKKWAQLAHEFGLTDMRDVAACHFDACGSEQLPPGQKRVLPELTLDNLETQYRQLTAGGIMCLALATNERLEIPWGISFPPHGFFPTSQTEDVLEIVRNAPPQVYLAQMVDHLDQLERAVLEGKAIIQGATRLLDFLDRHPLNHAQVQKLVSHIRSV